MMITFLRWWDILILSLLMFGYPIFLSTSMFFTSQSAQSEILFTATSNINGLIMEALQLGLAFLYLLVRKYDFSQWRFKITLKTTIYGILLYLLLSLFMDFVTIFSYGTEWIFDYTQENNAFLQKFEEFDATLIIFSLMNGFYEELFFLGICLAVQQKYLKYAFLYSLIIRFSFHTYQGFSYALGISLILGIIYFYFYAKRSKNLYPYILSHIIADILGLSIIALL